MCLPTGKTELSEATKAHADALYRERSQDLYALAEAADCLTLLDRGRKNDPELVSAYMALRDGDELEFGRIARRRILAEIRERVLNESEDEVFILRGTNATDDAPATVRYYTRIVK
jgi:hypothetical protein